MMIKTIPAILRAIPEKKEAEGSHQYDGGGTGGGAGHPEAGQGRVCCIPP
jgi:hypothetical protein